MAAERENSVQVIAKAAAVLDIIAHAGEASAAEIAERLNEPRSSVYRLLTSLQALDYVEVGSRRGTHRLGLKLLRLGTAVQSRLDVRSAAIGVMERIHDETGETVFLCLRRGDEAVCVERLDGRRVTTLALQLGGSLPLHAGAAPRALLAFAPRSEWHAYLAGGGLKRFSANTPADAESLIFKLEEVLSLGISISDEDVTPGIAALGAPIFDFRGAVSAALSISGMRASILGDEDGDRLKKLITGGAAEISRSLGYLPEGALNRTRQAQ